MVVKAESAAGSPHPLDHQRDSLVDLNLEKCGMRALALMMPNCTHVPLFCAHKRLVICTADALARKYISQPHLTAREIHEYWMQCRATGHASWTPTRLKSDIDGDMSW